MRKHSPKVVMQFIRDFQTTNGWTPTLREIGQACGISSTCTVDNILMGLEASGHIKRGRFKARTIVVTEVGG